jgi:hypothetical protein
MPAGLETAVRRVCVRLEKGHEGLLTESVGEGAVHRKGHKPPEEGKRPLFQIRQYAQPFCLVILEETEPAVKHGVGDAEADAESFNSLQMEKVFTDDSQYKEKAVGAVGDQGVSQDGMCTPAAPASDPRDPDRLTYGMAVEKVEDIAFIAGETDAAAPAPAVRADLHLRSEPFFLALIETGCRTFYTNKLASKDVLSYHSS